MCKTFLYQLKIFSNRLKNLAILSRFVCFLSRLMLIKKTGHQTGFFMRYFFPNEVPLEEEPEELPSVFLPNEVVPPLVFVLVF